MKERMNEIGEFFIKIKKTLETEVCFFGNPFSNRDLTGAETSNVRHIGFIFCRKVKSFCNTTASADKI